MRNNLMTIAVATLLQAATTGCSALTGPSETKKFKLGGSGGYRGKSVGNCDQKNANKECRLLGWDEAVDWECGTEHVSGGFFGCWDQDVMYSITCTR